MLDPSLQKQIFDAPVAEKQRMAEEMYEKYAADILRDAALRADVESLKKYGQQLGSHMAAAGMGKLCIRCGAGQGGGCCSLYMANETDAIQMLMNMLTGIRIREVNNDGKECCYLGKDGCLFLFKPMFCLNYNCRQIFDALSSEEICELEHLTGQLLTRQYEVEKRILDLICRAQKKS